MNAWANLTGHLQDPVRARIFFELMLNGNSSITIQEIANLTKRARNTINHHIDKMMEDDILSQGDSLKKGRGKPTRSFILNPRFLEALQVLPETGSLQSYFEALQRKSALLGMLSNLCMETFERSTESDISKEDIDLQDHFPMYLYTVNSTQEMERYREMLVDAIQEARRSTEDLDAEHSENMKYIVFTGYVPVFETGRS